MRKNNITNLLSFIVTVAASAPSLAQNRDPFVKDSSRTSDSPVFASKSGALVAQFDASLPQSVRIDYEVFSVPIEEAPKLYRGGGSDSIYAELTVDPEKYSAVLEAFSSLVSTSSMPATSEATSEFLYPTEFVPPASLKGNTEPSVIPAVPTAFETRNTGLTIEADYSLEPNHKFLPMTEKGLEIVQELASRRNNNVDPFGPATKPVVLTSEKISKAIAAGDVKAVKYISAVLRINHIELVGESVWGEGASKVEMPTFDVQSVRTVVNLVSGEPTFLGTMNPPKSSKVHSEGKRIWFAFVTATAVTAGL